MDEKLHHALVREGVAEAKARYLKGSLAEGFIDGWVAGWMDGSLTTKKLFLRQLLESRFGPLPEAVAMRIEIVTDSDRLTAAFAQALGVKTLDEFPPLRNAWED
jgi:hypothetical protein